MAEGRRGLKWSFDDGLLLRPLEIPSIIDHFHLQVSQFQAFSAPRDPSQNAPIIDHFKL